ncbi:hypothetical protein FOQG_03328 [Fusarium oxysporum f. sp. raphani 54005]|uniref:Uncharacterized protein n=4 Tax=Fusarium oxysporum TaxID=5507 RepID=X0CQ16_FUSOX|nr:hypothetical protein FOVG_00405 [Fusarium oxysporum f. sp. pisi HDV247]EXK96211.1 hypothetical protein FOQG_03328 [Fusarium oxysporum f. sp. raphani 54005]EXL89355.1 hypothetical protein FOPG_00082 [Fusarium oxysporum f. sp. conglutinans race 2 54008]EXM30426.1 hypothetical protein FOTG_04406 [Fusarium oxysporum f. sp. vasinfectum 25433]KAI8418070.1 hypothetical protein FOFC_00633 [Fusarium oxysporum]
MGEKLRYLFSMSSRRHYFQGERTEFSQKPVFNSRGYPAEASSTVPPSLLKSDRLDEFNGLWTSGWLAEDMKPLSLIWSRGTASP